MKSPLRSAIRRTALTGALALCGLANAGLLFDDLDWKESDVPPPPAFDRNKLVEIEMPRYMSLKFGVDPATIQITGDGVVRYVVVAANRESGGFNAFHEGVRCATEEYKTYARLMTDGKWEPTPDPEWKRIGNSRHTLALAVQAICRGRAPRASVADMIGHLKNPIREVE
jgi:hypothetical protein